MRSLNKVTIKNYTSLSIILTNEGFGGYKSGAIPLRVSVGIHGPTPVATTGGDEVCDSITPARRACRRSPPASLLAATHWLPNLLALTRSRVTNLAKRNRARLYTQLKSIDTQLIKQISLALFPSLSSVIKYTWSKQPAD